MIAALLVACTSAPSKPLAAGPVVPDVVARLECARCHDAPGKLADEPRERDCTGCHQAIFEGAFDKTHKAEAVARWKRRVHSLRYVPSLTGTARLQADWLDAFLQQPHDVRPGLPAMMPRLPMSDDERAALLVWLDAAPPDAAPETRGDPDAGLALLSARGCGACHTYSGTSAFDTPPPMGITGVLAPDLRHTRARMAPSAILSWLEDPAAVKPDTLMPTPALSEAERLDVMAALTRTPLDAPVAWEVPEPLPLLERPVTYAEVEEAVFHHVCWHCHSDPDGNGGDGGPGNTGGFGYAGAGLDLGSRDAILAGGATEGSPPLLVEAMVRRHRELAGQPGERPGMPLGLPPMSPEKIQLVASWIDQGCPP